MLQTGGSVQNLKTEIEAYRGVLLELQVAVVAIARHAIVEARIEEDLRRDEAVELEDEGVFPFQLHTLVGSVAIEARAPGQVLHQRPREIDRKLRAKVVEHPAVVLDAETGGEGAHTGVLHVVGQRSEMDVALQPVVLPIDTIVHTQREVDIERGKEVGVEGRVVGPIAVGELRVGEQLECVVPASRCLQAQLGGESD